MKKILRILLLYIPLCWLVLSLLLVLLFKWAPVRVTPLMLERALQGKGSLVTAVTREWTPIEKISKNMQRAVLASEDARFFNHKGFDMTEIKDMQKKHETKGKPVRGCSTVSQQTAKNCFTFGSRSLVRKVVEAYYTVLIEKIWGKKRILEVYLNIAETGPGLYGVQEAAKKYYGKNTASLTMYEAARLTLCLPNPLKRNPDWVARRMPTRCAEISAIASQTPLLY